MILGRCFTHIERGTCTYAPLNSLIPTRLPTGNERLCLALLVGPQFTFGKLDARWCGGYKGTPRRRGRGSAEAAWVCINMLVISIGGKVKTYI